MFHNILTTIHLAPKMRCLVGWLLALLATGVYMLTLEPSASFWDCGEFIASSYLLQVGHPPGSPLYWLLAHCFSWLAGGDVMAVAHCCNALSALAGGLTVMFLYLTLCLMHDHLSDSPDNSPLMGVWLPAVGALCYLFCDTAWFSAVESEVYALAVLFASVALWAMMRWYGCEQRRRASRWLYLVALLLGLGTCVHLLVLLVTPALFALMVLRWRKEPLSVKNYLLCHPFHASWHVVLLILFFGIGLTPYSIVPIRAAANPPINIGNPSNGERFHAYFSRQQYEHAPLYPRMWRHHEMDAVYSADWSGGDDGFWGNMCYFGSYQLSYMYLRYFMWNFSGRYNDRQGYGNLQNGQFITGIPFLDRFIVGTGKMPPTTLAAGHHAYYLLPLLLGVVGACYHFRHNRRAFWVVLVLFLVSGVGLSVYLNHPAYEPRERDYAYVLSFYAFCLWIGAGAVAVVASVRRSAAKVVAVPLLFGVPLLMACQNWSDHDRSHRYIARDTASNILNSCENNAILLTWGDNDTFPLWYVQQVEGCRTDVQVYNVNLTGYNKCISLIRNQSSHHPIYVSHYAQRELKSVVPCVLAGFAYRVDPILTDSIDVTLAYENVMHHLRWSDMQGVYVDEVSCRFLEQYWNDVLLLVSRLTLEGAFEKANLVLDKTLDEIPLECLRTPQIAFDVAEAYATLNPVKSHAIKHQLRGTLQAELDYFHRLSPRQRRLLPYTIPPREQLLEQLPESD